MKENDDYEYNKEADQEIISNKDYPLKTVDALLMENIDE